MKKILLTLMVLAVTANAGLLGMIGSMNDPTVKSKKYAVDAYGVDLRTYEFTPMSNKNKTCVIVVIDNNNASTMQMECFDKRTR